MIRWGFLGAGSIATQALAPAVHAASGASLQAVAARSLSRAAALGPATAYDDYHALLADPQVDAVYISLTNEQHLPWSVAAMRAGKAVLCEKPLALTAGEVDELSAVSARTGQLLVEASWYRWHPRIRLAQSRLAEVGPVRHVSAGFTFAGQLEGNFRLEPGRGGGALYDVGCYAVSSCLWAVGRGLPTTVSAQSSWGPSGVDLDSRLELSWEGAAAQVHVGIDRDQGQWLVITGDAGGLELRDAPYTSWKDDVTHLQVGGSRVDIPATDAYRVMVEEVSSVIGGGPGWVLPLEESRQGAAVLDAAFASAASGGGPVAPGGGAH